MSKILSREDFLAKSKKLKLELVQVPELDGSVYLRELSARQLLEYNERIEKLRKENAEITTSVSLELMSLLVSLSACDENGNVLFTEADVRTLSENSVTVLITLSAKVMELSGVGNAVIDEVVDNLKKVPTGSSTTA